MSLKTGNYFLFAADLHNRPIGEESQGDTHVVVVQPPGTEPQKWRIENIGNERYILRFNEYTAVKEGDRVLLVPILPGPEPPFVWKIIPTIRTPPGPEAIFGISVPDVIEEAWYTDKNSPLLEVPVAIFSEASAIAIAPIFD